MAVSGKKKATRKVIMVRIFCVIVALLFIIPLLLSSLTGGSSW
jgi:hypothetical protein